jgi:uncharacterized protein (TIGR02246 family)
MAARTPGELHSLFTGALNRGDLQGLLELYEPTASLVPEPGRVVTGTEAISQALQMFLAMKPTIRIETRGVVRTGDLAVLQSNWTLDCTSPEGSPMQMTGHATEVVRQQSDGTWLYAIDLPYGMD